MSKQLPESRLLLGSGIVFSLWVLWRVVKLTAIPALFPDEPKELPYAILGEI